MNKPVLISIAVVITMTVGTNSDPASEQLNKFKYCTNSSIGVLTTNNGAWVEMNDTVAWNTPGLLDNEYFMESITSHVRENIPDRIVHAKGTGAFGYFKVTHNLTDICKASPFASNGKITRVAVRFSQTFGDKGEADTLFTSRGFAVKFYSEDGNLDIVGFNTLVFAQKDPAQFPLVNHAFKRNPATNLKDLKSLWDIVASKPEVLPILMYLFGDDGIPDGYRHMSGHSIHTYQVYNEYGTSHFVRFHFLPDSGLKSLSVEEGNEVGCSDPDYAVRDLYNAIKKGKNPSWTLKVQVLSSEDLKKCKFDPFDVTKILPEYKYPLRPVGKLVLNRNPTNHFAEVEQLAFCPGNLIKGVLGGPDILFKARRLAYKEGQRYRLGANFHNIEVNKALHKVQTYNRDGRAPVGNNGGGSPNYYPNSYNGPEPYVDKNKPRLMNIKQNDDSYNFEQLTDLFMKMSRDERQRLIRNIVTSLIQADKSVQDKIVALFKRIHSELAMGTVAALAKSNKK